MGDGAAQHGLILGQFGKQTGANGAKARTALGVVPGDAPVIFTRPGLEILPGGIRRVTAERQS